MIPIALGISVLMFALLTLAPGDPVDLLISSDPRVKPEDVVRLKHLYGLDQPIHIRYLKWLGRTVQGDLGFSRTYKEPVTELMRDRIGNSLWLTVTAFVLAVGVAVPVGIYSALHQYSWLDYVRTARAKGLAEGVVINKHALRNALIPLITIMALSISGLFAGAPITETVFAWPGVGRLLVDSVIGGDYVAAQAVLMFLAVLVLIFNLMADIGYAFLDPRIRYD